MAKFKKPEIKNLFFESKEAMLEDFPENDDKFIVDTWNKKGRPFLWVKVEEKDNFAVYVDYAYGGLMLKYKGKEIGRGKDNIQFITENISALDKDVVVLDKDYYNVKKYLWF